MKHYMCFDIGGTSIKFGVAGENGTLLQKGEIPNVITKKGVEGLIENLASVAEQNRQEYSLHGIAVSTAGVVEPEQIHADGINGIDYNWVAFHKHPDWVERAHALGLTVNVWTVDSPEEMKYLKDLGVDVITTNRPDLAAGL